MVLFIFLLYCSRALSHSGLATAPPSLLCFEASLLQFCLVQLTVLILVCNVCWLSIRGRNFTPISRFRRKPFQTCFNLFAQRRTRAWGWSVGAPVWGRSWGGPEVAGLHLRQAGDHHQEVCREAIVQVTKASKKRSLKAVVLTQILSRGDVKPYSLTSTFNI